MTNELQKLAALEALANPGSSAAPLWFLALRSPLTSVPRLDKSAAAGLARAAATGDQRAQKALDGQVPAFITRTLGSLGRRMRLKSSEAQKTSQLEDIAEAIDIIPAFNGVSSTDSVLDAVLQLQQRRNYMNYAVKKHIKGRKVLPPVWWGGTSDDWRMKLDGEAKKQMVREMF